MEGPTVASVKKPNQLHVLLSDKLHEVLLESLLVHAIGEKLLTSEGETAPLIDWSRHSLEVSVFRISLAKLDHGVGSEQTRTTVAMVA
jgi:hypothetical protein